MKRILFFLFALLILAPLCLAGCSNTSLEQIEIPEETENSTPTKNPDEPENPADDGVITVLMIGNSFSTGFSDEIIGLASAHGIRMRLYNVYYSGCPMSSHWNWYVKGEKQYDLYMHEAAGVPRTVENGVGLYECLRKENWDYISMQQHFYPGIAISYDASMNSCTPYTEKLASALRKKYPMAKLLWHQTWAYEVGFEGIPDESGVVPEEKKVPTLEKQTTCYQVIRNVSIDLCSSFSLGRVPSGDAWQIARANPLIGDTLCQKQQRNDKYHDGDVGGGQYLNACVWFEVLTGQSAVGNTWRPIEYSLPEEKIAALQNAAHSAVSAL
jgi:hypothetical protein